MKNEKGQQELEETSYRLELPVDSGIAPARRLAALQEEAEELAAIFASSAITAKRNK